VDFSQAVRRVMDGLLRFLGISSEPDTPDLSANVFVMLPLDFALESRALSPSQFHQRLRRLADIGVRGVMVDVWWGLCEPQPEVYDFSKFVDLADQCKSLSLEMQAVMSFHQCGGNVGDSVYIPLPSWAVEIGNEHRVWFVDREGRLNREYISFGADYDPIFHGRTALDVYRDYIQAFESAMGDRMGSVVSEIQVGVGPCGELRYPSYRMEEGLWKFPGIGEFQCFDRYLLADLKAAANDAGRPEWGTPPEQTGSYNSQPQETQFFRNKEDGGSWVEDGSRFFANWYSDRMIRHGEAIIASAAQVANKYNGKVSLACKVAGIHWWYGTQSHAAEMAAGYNNAGHDDTYDKIAKMLKKYDVIFDFTCLEMYNLDQPESARCEPENLVRQVLTAVARHGLRFAGENALPRYDQKAYQKIENVYKEAGSMGIAFTYLRFTDDLFRWWNFWTFSSFVQRMKPKSRL